MYLSRVVSGILIFFTCVLLRADDFYLPPYLTQMAAANVFIHQDELGAYSSGQTLSNNRLMAYADAADLLNKITSEHNYQDPLGRLQSCRRNLTLLPANQNTSMYQPLNPADDLAITLANNLKIDTPHILVDINDIATRTNLRNDFASHQHINYVEAANIEVINQRFDNTPIANHCLIKRSIHLSARDYILELCTQETGAHAELRFSDASHVLDQYPNNQQQHQQQQENLSIIDINRSQLLPVNDYIDVNYAQLFTALAPEYQVLFGSALSYQSLLKQYFDKQSVSLMSNGGVFRDRNFQALPASLPQSLDVSVVDRGSGTHDVAIAALVGIDSVVRIFQLDHQGIRLINEFLIDQSLTKMQSQLFYDGSDFNQLAGPIKLFPTDDGEFLLVLQAGVAGSDIIGLNFRLANNSLELVSSWSKDQQSLIGLGSTQGMPALINRRGGGQLLAVPIGHRDNNNLSPMVYLLDPASGNLIHTLTPNSVSPVNSEGVLSLSLLHRDQDRYPEYILFGDFEGRVWKYDARSDVVTDWHTAHLSNTHRGEPMFRILGADSQPLITAPIVSRQDDQGNHWLYIASGRYLGMDDHYNASQRSHIYKIPDGLRAVDDTDLPVAITLDKAVSADGLVLEGSKSNIQGAYRMRLFEFAQVLSPSTQFVDQLYYTIFVADQNICEASAEQWLLALSAVETHISHNSSEQVIIESDNNDPQPDMIARLPEMNHLSSVTLNAQDKSLVLSDARLMETATPTLGARIRIQLLE